VTVNPGVNPTARFTFSPTAPTTATDVNFNAVSSTAAPGRRIVSYTWDFGDNTSGTGVQPTPHRYTRPGTYTVTLTVTDDVGRTNSVALTVTVT
jgi:PKD repeat protein